MESASPRVELCAAVWPLLHCYSTLQHLSPLPTIMPSLRLQLKASNIARMGIVGAYLGPHLPSDREFVRRAITCALEGSSRVDPAAMKPPASPAAERAWRRRSAKRAVLRVCSISRDHIETASSNRHLVPLTAFQGAEACLDELLDRTETACSTMGCNVTATVPESVTYSSIWLTLVPTMLSSRPRHHCD